MKSIKEINYVEREKRKKETAEVFTPRWMIEEMLDKIPAEIWEEDKEFLDSSCGNGNILVAVLDRKIKQGHDPDIALDSIYGLDIKSDNIRECRLRLLELVAQKKKISKLNIKTIFTNVRWMDQTKWPEGSLDYDMSFLPNFNQKNIDRWHEALSNKKNNVIALPVDSNDDVDNSLEVITFF